MATYGLTATGFTPKPFSVIQAELQEDYKAIHGVDLDVSDYSLAGQEINNLAKKFADRWEAEAALYASFNPDTNTGKSQDGSAALVGVRRPEPIPSEAQVVMYGDSETVVGAGTILEQTTTKLHFSLYANTTISLSTASDVTIACVAEPIADDIFSVTINGSVYTYVVVGTKTKQQVIHELYLLIQAGSIVVDVTEGTETLRIFTTDFYVPFSISATAVIQFDIIGSVGRFVCTENGANYVPANSLITILTPVTGLDSVDNILAGITGRGLMGDDTFRVYRRTNLQTNAKATEGAIQSNLEELLGVTYVRVISNRTLVVDLSGRPAKSFETIVQGGAVVDIAETIWLNMPAGIEPYGTITEIVVDSTGRDQTIKFSRPVSKYVWIQIEVDDSGESPGNAAQLIKDAIYAWAQIKTNVDIGEDIIFDKHYAPVYSVEGIKKLNFMRIGISDDALTPPASYVSVNIEMDDAMLPEYAIARMEVNLI